MSRVLGDVFQILQGGNVGLGTTAPRAKLDVIGDTLFSGSVSAASLTGSAISDSISTTSSTIAASSTAVKTAYDLANAALPLSGGTMTGDILTSVTANVGIGTTVARSPLDVIGDVLVSGSVSAASLTGAAISDSISTTSSTIAASSTAVKTAYDLANAALPLSGGTMTGDILTSVTANVGIGTTVARVALDVTGDVLVSGSISAASLTGSAISDSISTTSSTIAASSTAVKTAYDIGAAALPRSGGTMTGTLVTNDIYTSNLTLYSRAALLLPAGSNSERPTPTIDGYIRYNQELSQFEGYSQNTWGAIGGASTGFSPWSSNGSNIYYTAGNVGIGTTDPLVSLDIRSTDALYLPSGSNSARPAPAKDGYIRYNQELSQFEGYSQNTWGAIGGTGTTGDVISATDITTSNLTIINTLTFGPTSGILKNRLQVNSLRKVTYVETSTCNEFYLDTEGIFGAQASNVDIYIGLKKLLYYSSNITYYNVNYINTPTRTYYTISLTEPAVFGDLVDITVWPQFIEASSNLPGYVYQQIIGGTGSTTGVGWPTSTSNDIYYILGNVGIGTSNTTLAMLTVAGDILPSACNVYDLGSSNYRWRDIYLSGDTIDLGGMRISHDVVTNSMRVYKKSDTSSANILSDFYAKNVYTTGPIGIGTTLPQCKMHIFPTDTANLMQIDYGQQSDIFDYPPSAITGNSATISGQAYGNGAYTISSSSYYNPHQPYYVFDKGIPSVYSKWISQKFLYNSSGSYVGAQTTTHTTGSVSGEWLQIYLPSVIQIASYSIAHSSDDLATNRAPYKWYIFGSTNGTTWVLLDTEDNYTSWVGNSYSTFSVSTTQSYTYYRWVFEKVQVNSADGFVSINEIKLTTGSSSIAPLFVATSAGNIGIGTNLPTAGLHVKGNARIDGNLTVTGSNITNINVINSIEYNGSNVIINNISGAGPALKVCQTGVGASYPIADFYDNDISISVPAFRIADGGNVGIGLTNPLQKLDVNGNINFTGDIYKNGFLFSGGGDSIPIGTIVPFYGSNLTDNSYLICDGSTYNRSTYTELANFLGVSPSATTFQVPDLRDRFLKGKGTASLVKDIGGSNLKMLTTANMPAHTHTGTTDAAGSHKHTYDKITGYVGTYGMKYPADTIGLTFAPNTETSTEPAHTHTFTTASTGSGTAFDIQPPYTVVNYIIKAFTNIYTTPIRSGDYWSKTASNVWFQSGSVGIATSIVNYPLDVNGNINFTGDLYKNGNIFTVGDTVPIGTIVPFYGSNLTDSSYLICDGSTYNRSTYTELANFLGVSPSATTFQVPDLRDRFLKGKGISSTLKTTGGAATKTLSISEMPAHTHTGTTDGGGRHIHGGGNYFDRNSTGGAYSGDNQYFPIVGRLFGSATPLYNTNMQYDQNVYDHTHTFTTASTGSGTAFDIQPPYTVVNYIIKAFTNQYTTTTRTGDYWSKTASNVWFQSGSVGIATSIVNYPLDVNGNINFTGDLYKNGNIFTVGDTVPIGTIIPFYGSNLTDSSYLICDGSTYNRSTYTELANFLGVSPSATTFQVPDLRDRFLKGKGTSSTLKTTGGAATKTLSISEMPAHTHTGTTDAGGTHRHNVTSWLAPGNGYGGAVAGTGAFGNVFTGGDGSSYTSSTPHPIVAAPDHTHTFTTASTGSGTAFDIQPPFTVVNYIIKAFNNQYTTTTRTGDYWSKTASNVWFQSGSVGIATNVPQATLHVNGNTITNNITINQSSPVTYLSGTSSGQWIGMAANITAGAYNGITQANDSAIIFSSGTANNGALVIAPWMAEGYSGIRINNSGTTVLGNLGIGNTNPPVALTVSRDATLSASQYAGDNAQGQLYLTGATNTNKRLALLYDTTTDKSYIQSMVAGTGPTPLILNNAGGYVGIGTSIPQSALHVQGNATFTGNISSPKFSVVNLANNLSSFQTNVNTQSHIVNTSVTLYGGTILLFANFGGYSSVVGPQTWTLQYSTNNGGSYANIGDLTFFFNQTSTHATAGTTFVWSPGSITVTNWRVFYTGSFDQNDRLNLSLLQLPF